MAPQFPVDTWDDMINNGPHVPLRFQNLESWLRTFAPIASSFRGDQPPVFVGHSLGPLFILHAVLKYNIRLDSAIFVSPFLSSLKRWEFNHANSSFYKQDFDFERLKHLIPLSYVLYSDNDPYVASELSVRFGRQMGSALIPIRKAGHLNSEVNLNEFPLVLDLCMSRIDLSLYQRFLEHRKAQIAQSYIMKNPDQGSLRLRASDVTDEGIFHFRHLKKRGFCTLYTGLLGFWDPESAYMRQARLAARRIGGISRVCILDDCNVLNSPIFRKQVTLDLENDIRIYLCRWDWVRDQVTEPDFGIWDDEYVCIVRQNPMTGEVTEAELNSRLQDIRKYQQWERYILSKSIPIRRIRNLDDSAGLLTPGSGPG